MLAKSGKLRVTAHRSREGQGQRSQQGRNACQKGIERHNKDEARKELWRAHGIVLRQGMARCKDKNAQRLEDRAGRGRVDARGVSRSVGPPTRPAQRRVRCVCVSESTNIDLLHWESRSGNDSLSLIARPSRTQLR